MATLWPGAVANRACKCHGNKTSRREPSKLAPALEDQHQHATHNPPAHKKANPPASSNVVTWWFALLFASLLGPTSRTSIIVTLATLLGKGTCKDTSTRAHSFKHSRLHGKYASQVESQRQADHAEHTTSNYNAPDSLLTNAFSHWPSCQQMIGLANVSQSCPKAARSTHINDQESNTQPHT